MCLHKLENFPVTQSRGWQVFSKSSSGKLYPLYFGEGPVPVGKWQRDIFRIVGRWIHMAVKYKKGFHIFLNEEDAKVFCPDPENYRIKKVRFKRVVARGFQELATGGQTRLAKVVVCRKRFVEPN